LTKPKEKTPNKDRQFLYELQNKLCVLPVRNQLWTEKDYKIVDKVYESLTAHLLAAELAADKRRKRTVREKARRDASKKQIKEKIKRSIADSKIP